MAEANRHYRDVCLSKILHNLPLSNLRSIFSVIALFSLFTVKRNDLINSSYILSGDTYFCHRSYLYSIPVFISEHCIDLHSSSAKRFPISFTCYRILLNSSPSYTHIFRFHSPESDPIISPGKHLFANPFLKIYHISYSLFPLFGSLCILSNPCVKLKVLPFTYPISSHSIYAVMFLLFFLNNSFPLFQFRNSMVIHVIFLIIYFVFMQRIFA